MKRKRFSVEEIVAVLKQAEPGLPVLDLIRQVGISELLRDECLNVHWLETITEARRLIEA